MIEIFAWALGFAVAALVLKVFTTLAGDIFDNKNR
jgi:hypothetical protein